MKITNLEVANFRGIDSLKIPFDPKITVIIGKNGVGKSSILDATASLLKAIQFSWKSDIFNPRGADVNVRKEDVKIPSRETFYKIELDWEDHKKIEGRPISIEASTKYNQIQNESHNRFFNYGYNGSLSETVRPLIVYYRQDRGFEEKGEVNGAVDVTSAIVTSIEGKLQAIGHLQAWWDKRDAQEARNVRDNDPSFRDPQLQAIRSLITQIDNFKSITYDSIQKPEGLYFQKIDGTVVHVNMLSSGERSFIILLADLARRLQMMQPESLLADIPGIILIDEIELNLHPDWQSKILVTLLEVFKSCQFVITTHSPQVISSIESEHVRILDRTEGGKIEVKYPIKTKGQTSNYLLEGVFGAHERFPRTDTLIHEFNQAIDGKDKAEATRLFGAILADIEGESPELLLLKKRLKMLGEPK